MLQKTKILSAILCLSSLSACTSDKQPDYENYQNYNYEGQKLYPEGYESSSYTDYQPEQPAKTVPDSYNVSNEHPPTPAKEVDKTWVNNQNSAGYTIELADGDKASKVAETLSLAPKNERTAEIKYNRDGKTYYKGLYGTYPNEEAAKTAINNLPADVKQNASIKPWRSIQNTEPNM